MLKFRKFNLENDKEEFYNLILDMKEYFTDYEKYTPTMEEVLEEFYYDIPAVAKMEDKELCLVYKDNNIVGFYDMLKYFPNENSAMIGLLAIHRDYRNKNIGETVFERIEESIISENISDLYINVVLENPAVKFWERVGFVYYGDEYEGPYGKEAKFRKKLVQEKCYYGEKRSKCQ